MEAYQPQVASVVVAFVPRPRGAAYLTPLDRIDISLWREQARFAGYDRMVIHDREPFDSPDVGDFLCVYRAGECWGRWGFARRCDRILAWCCITGGDIGEFSSLAHAFESVLPATKMALPPTADTHKVVTTFVPRRCRVSAA